MCVCISSVCDHGQVSDVDLHLIGQCCQYFILGEWLIYLDFVELRDLYAALWS